MSGQVRVVNFYKFVDIDDCQALKDAWLPVCQQLQLRGTILLAHEGINAAVCGAPQDVETFIQHVRQDSRFADIEPKDSFTQNPPFNRMKIRLKKEIVSMGIDDVDPQKVVGTYVDPQEWNALISDPDVIVVDTRNDYEIEVGKFKGAVDPQTSSFRQFPEYVRNHLKDHKDAKIAMYCTGGIRCEKATSFMKEMGFDKVYHLKGGILKYIETIPPEKSLWEGDCFVFDHRVAVDHKLKLSDYTMCFACRHALNEEDRAHPDFELGLSCPYCIATLTEEKKQRLKERMRQMKVHA